MAHVEPATTVALTALLKGDTLVVTLTDGRQHADFGIVSEAHRRIGALLEHRFDIHQRTAALSRQEAATIWCEYGRRIAAELLPQSIGAALFGGSRALLSLQMSASLAGIDWELALGDQRLLGEAWPLARQLVVAVGPTPPPPALHRQGPLQVLVVVDNEADVAAAPAVRAVVARLRAMDHTAVTVAHLRDLGPGELTRLAVGDVLHYFGPLSDDDEAPRGPGRAELRALFASSSVPGLLVLQSTSPQVSGTMTATMLVANATSARHGVLLCHADAHAADLTSAFYGALLDGAVLAEAVRTARERLHRDHGLAALASLRLELYGDCGACLFARDRRPSADKMRRQVTAMKIDLVGSTALMQALGDEAYSALVRRFHELSATILSAHGGAPNAPQGNDGTMCYFGLPVAREDAAVEALRAGFELIDAVQALGLSMRIGVCTGEVVVQDGQPYGPPVHFAERLQSIAAAGTIAVGESTTRIVRGRFRFQRLEVVERIKGFEKHEACYRALGPAPPAIDEDVPGKAPRMPPFVGRHQELAMLDAHWRSASAGSGRLVRIVGEAGIGKSRLIREFKRVRLEHGHQAFECRCAAEHAGSAFRPLIEALRSELRLVPAERPEAVVERLRRVVAGVEPIGNESLALLADLLGVGMPERHAVLDLPSERRRQLTVELLVTLACRRLARAAGCMLVEDVHWVDPSTAECLDRLLAATRDLPFLVIVTLRSDTEPAWHPRAPTHEMQLRGLSPETSRALVLGTCGEQPLPNDVVHQIAVRGDGVPLFIEESTRMAVEQRQTLGDGALLCAPQVPGTILDLLIARLDRLGSAKQIAQAGGAIGREFPLPLLRAVLQHPGSPIGGNELDARLDALQRSGMLLAREDGAQTRYAFRHALMRDAAYRSLLGRDRARLHEVIAEVVAEQFPDLVAREPELLAYHHAEAGADAEALRHWELAARQAASRSAQVEAIGHLHRALGVLQRMPAGDGRDRQELRLQLLLAARLIATHGYGAERVGRVYVHALELARALGDDAARQRVLLGLEGWHFMRADFAQARACVLEAASCGGTINGAIQQVQTQWALANTLMHEGQMQEAVEQMDDCLARYEGLAHRADAVQDPGVMCLCYSAWSKWQLGFPDQALERVTRVVRRAEQLKHKFSLGEAYGFQAAVYHFRGENSLALESADRAIEVCEASGFAVWLAHARVMRGRALAELGQGAVGVEEMRRGYELWAATGAVVTTPFYLTMRAEGLALCGRHDEALVLLKQALAVVERTGERYYEPEIRRLLGRLCWVASDGNAAHAGEAERWLLQALEGASSRRLLSLALRAAIDVADLYVATGRAPDARRVLQPAYDAIEEGRDTRDLVTAARQLAALGRDTVHRH